MTGLYASMKLYKALMLVQKFKWMGLPGTFLFIL